jgi:hypothetical protein
MKLYTWTVGEDYDWQHILVFAETLEEARKYALERDDVVKCIGGYDVHLNDVNKNKIMTTEPDVVNINIGSITAFQYGTG